MSRIRINDLPPLETLTAEELARIFGAGRGNQVSLQVEDLEKRELLAASASLIASQAVPNWGTSQVLQVTGTEAADKIVVSNDVPGVKAGNYVNVRITDSTGSVVRFSKSFYTLTLKNPVIRVDSLGSDDTVYNDTSYRSYMDGGAGDDQLFGETFADQLFGRSGNNTLNGRAGNDFLTGGGDSDVLIGEWGSDTMWGSGGDDRLFGGFFFDDTAKPDGSIRVPHGVSIDASSDWLYGGEGKDSLHGGSGQDYLYGEAGSDRLDGGYDGFVDQLYGGADADQVAVYTGVSYEVTSAYWGYIVTEHTQHFDTEDNYADGLEDEYGDAFTVYLDLNERPSWY